MYVMAQNNHRTGAEFQRFALLAHRLSPELSPDSGDSSFFGTCPQPPTSAALARRQIRAAARGRCGALPAHVVTRARDRRAYPPRPSPAQARADQDARDPVPWQHDRDLAGARQADPLCRVAPRQISLAQARHLAVIRRMLAPVSEAVLCSVTKHMAGRCRGPGSAGFDRHRHMSIQP